ncbi:MAG TPA: hypothetical protein VNO19_13970 [Gemmatimonadales bacterium]|nr:hypothetical protein [Gemmatimonadales bacterium]
MALMRWLIILAFTTTLQAQSAHPVVSVPVAVGQFIPVDRPAARLDTEAELRVNTVVASRDYRWEGGAIGALLVGALGYRYASATCDGDSGTGQSCLGHDLTRIAMGALVGGVTGLFIGSSIKKGPDSAQ